MPTAIALIARFPPSILTAGRAVAYPRRTDAPTPDNPITFFGPRNKSIPVNAYEQLIGQSFVRFGTRFTIVKCIGTAVIAACLHNQQVKRLLVPLADVLNSLDVPEIEMTELPEEASDSG